MGFGDDDEIDGRLWGKEAGLTHAYPVICHMLDAAAVAGAVWDALVPAPFAVRLASKTGATVGQFRAMFMFWAGAHDLGKVSPAHQGLVDDLLKVLVSNGDYPGPERFDAGGPRHDRVGRLVLPRLLEELGYGGGRWSAADSIAQILGGHHGRFHESGPVPNCGAGPWEVQRRRHVRLLQRFTGADVPLMVRLDASESVALCGLVIIADWLASNTDTYQARMDRLPAGSWQVPGLLSEAVLRAHWEDAVAGAAQVVAEVGLGSAVFKDRTFAEAFPSITDPYALQESIAEQLPGLAAAGGAGILLVTAPTGDGKTETANFACSVLSRAAGANGAVFALPTMSTADAMYPRFGSFIEANADGAVAVTLAHSLDLISKALRRSDVEAPPDAGECGQAAPSSWLQQGWRRLAARFSVVTIDQLLAGVLPTRFNALRLSGLLGKVLVVDEAHAYGPWMHQLLQRLLEWCAAMGVPVVLLSATLTGKAAGSLVNAYRRGAGQPPAEVQAPYPGWLYSDAQGQVTSSGRLPSARESHLHLDVWPVRFDPDAAARTTRRAVLREVADRVAGSGGRVVVICGTVDAAQRTWNDLTGHLEGTSVEVALLHSRLASHQREFVTAWAEQRFGKHVDKATKRKQHHQILIATSIVEQSLDWDFDLVVTDLAPVALLLQRAGRCWRHSGWHRPTWLAHGPTLTVLDPIDSKGDFDPPVQWNRLHPKALLDRTRDLLYCVKEGGIAVPGDVQNLIDDVYAEAFDFRSRDLEAMTADDHAAWRDSIEADELEWIATEIAESALAKTVAIPAPRDVADLSALSGANGTDLISDELVTTRLGADSERVVCLYTQPGGEHTLDADGQIAVPGTGTTPLNVDAIRTIMRHSLPAPAAWLTGIDTATPAGWGRRGITRHLRAIRMTRAGEHWRNREGKRPLLIDHPGFRGLWRGQ